MGLKDGLRKRFPVREKEGTPDGKSKRKRMIIAVGAVLLVLLIGWRVFGSLQEAALKKAAEMNRQTYIPVETLTVQKQDIVSSITLSGKVAADKEAPVMVKTPGKAAVIHTKVGDKVQKNQVLFSLDKSDMLISYNQALAGYQMAEAGYQAAINKYNNDLKTLENMRELYKVGAISKSELDQVELLASDATRQTIESQFAQAKAGYESARKALEDMDVKAPIDGILTSLDVSVGALVSNAAPAAKVVDLNTVHITVSVSEKEINNISQGQEVEVEIPSASLKVKGLVEELSVAANAQGKYTIKTSITNKDGVVKPGMFANVTLSTAVKNKVVAVPTDALTFRNGKNVVYVVQDKAAVEKTVTVGLENGTKSEIVSGLNAGDIVIVKGQSYVSDGSEVKIVVQDGQPASDPEPVANPEGGGKQ